MFELCREPPEPGSPTEIMFLMLWRMRQDIQLATHRAVIQALIGQEGAEQKASSKAFEDLKDAMFPFDKKERAYEEKRAKEYLMREIAKGPLGVTPMVDVNQKKNVGRLARGQAALERRQDLLKQGRVTDIDIQSRSRQSRTRRAF